VVKLAGSERIQYLFAMATTCRSCGAALPEGADRCPSCFAKVKPPGFFERLFGRLKFNFTVTTKPGPAIEPGIHINTTVRRTIKVRDPATGEFKEYHSLDEVPADYREKLRQAMAQTPVRRQTHITLTGPDGAKRTYNSLEEVPPEMRKLIEDAQQATDSK